MSEVTTFLATTFLALVHFHGSAHEGFSKGSAVHVCMTTPVARVPFSNLNIIVHMHTRHLESLSYHTLAPG